MQQYSAELVEANRRLLEKRKSAQAKNGKKPLTPAERPSLPASALPADLKPDPPKTAVSPPPPTPAPQPEPDPLAWLATIQRVDEGLGAAPIPTRSHETLHIWEGGNLPKEPTAVSAALAAAPAIVQKRYKSLKTAASGGGVLPPNKILTADLEKLEARLLAGEAKAVGAEMEATAAKLAAAGQAKAETVTVFAQMMTAAARMRHELSMRLWLAVRWLAVNRDGRRNVARWDDVLDTFSRGGEFPITSRANLRRQLNQAARRGYFRFSKDDSDIYYLSERKVISQILSLPHVGGGAVEMSIDELCAADFVKNRARFFSSLDAGRGEDFAAPISRQSRYNETGRHKRTQRKYEELQQTEKRENFEYVGEFTKRAYWKAKEAERRGGLTAEDRPAIVATLDNGRKIIAKQLPNSYSAKMRVGQKSRKRLNRRIKHLRILSPNHAGSFDAEIQDKIYFDDNMQAAEAAGERYLLLKNMSNKAGVYRLCI